MSDNVNCNGKTYGDCINCGKKYSSHSLHYDSNLKRKVSNISCSIGGDRYFDEDGDEIR